MVLYVGLHPNFLGSLCHVSEVLEQASADEQRLSQLWKQQDLFLCQMLNLKRFTLESSKVKSWLENEGVDFISASNKIGSDVATTEQLIKEHDSFESKSEVCM